MTHGSLFSGIGGFDLGAERAGFQNLWACEIDEFKQQILHKHFPDTQIYSDVTTLNPPYVDVISGGFPCQDISVSQYNFKNNRYGEYGIKGKRSGLWTEYARVIRCVRPKYILIENSPMLPVRGLEVVLCDLAACGDAVIPTITEYLFRALVEFDKSKQHVQKSILAIKDR